MDLRAIQVTLIFFLCVTLVGQLTPLFCHDNGYNCVTVFTSVVVNMLTDDVERVMTVSWLLYDVKKQLFSTLCKRCTWSFCEMTTAHHLPMRASRRGGGTACSLDPLPKIYFFPWFPINKFYCSLIFFLKVPLKLKIISFVPSNSSKKYPLFPWNKMVMFFCPVEIKWLCSLVPLK